MIYGDYNAGAPLRPEALAAMVSAAEAGGNPSSVHAAGRRAKATLEAAREEIANALCARAQDVVFTSGATEALHLALAGAKSAGVGRVLIVSALEHDAVVAGAASLWPTALCAPALRSGLVDLDGLREALREAGERPLVALQLANNETGAVQPVKEAVAWVHEAGGQILVDAAQAFGKRPVDMAELGADYLVVSSHKVGGPQGAGALVLACGAPFAPPRGGGGQEQGRRPGTENVPAVAGFAAAARMACAGLPRETPRLTSLVASFENGLRARTPDVVIFGEDVERLPNTSLFAVPGWRAEAALIALDLAGVALSSGAACSSGKVRPSRVLSAMGVPADLAACALRVSFGWDSRAQDVEAILAALAKVTARANHHEAAR